MSFQRKIPTARQVMKLCKITFACALTSLSLKTLADCGAFNQFVDHRNGTVTDPRTGVVWKRCAEGFEWTGSSCSGRKLQVKYQEATRIAQESRYLGFYDWRLPTIDELDSVTKMCEVGDNKKVTDYAASKMIAHPTDSDLSAGAYWSSTLWSPTSDRDNWQVSFDNGMPSSQARELKSMVRLVRSSR